jgi:hypothetical protein
MRVRQIRIGVLAFFLAYLCAVVWPGALLFRSAEPFILGIPFSFFWPALWIALGGGALGLLDLAEERAAADGSGRREPNG